MVKKGIFKKLLGHFINITVFVHEPITNFACQQVLRFQLTGSWILVLRLRAIRHESKEKLEKNSSSFYKLTKYINIICKTSYA